MTTAAWIPISGKAVAASLAGLGAVLCGILTVSSNVDLFLAGVVLFWLLAVALGIRAKAEIRRADGQLSGGALAVMGMTMPVVGFALGFLLLPFRLSVAEAAARTVSANNVKQIALAMYDYAAEHGSRLPPAALCDERGKPLLSWRVLILPYIEQGNLYKQFKLDEPWDSPHNIKLLDKMPWTYAPPRDLPVTVQVEPSTTFYQVFTGPGAAFEGTVGLKYPGDFPDGTSNTILVIEAGESIPWTKPADLRYDPEKPLPPLGGIFTGEGRFSLFGPSRAKGFNVALGDASVRFIRPTISEATLRDAITRNDGRDLGSDW